MAGLDPNPQLEFYRRDDRESWEGSYKDEQARWRILVEGEREAVRTFVEQRALYLQVIPLSEEEAAERLASFQSLEIETDPPRSQQEVESDETGPQLPRLQLQFVMEELALSPPYQLRYAIDPPAPYCHAFSLQSEDTLVNEKCTAQTGKVKMSLGSSKTGTIATNQSKSITFSAPPYSGWTVRVDPVPADSTAATFSLEGDHTVF